MTEAELMVTEAKLMAEIDDIVSTMTASNGAAPPVEWVAREMERRHLPRLSPPGFPAAKAEMIIGGAHAGFRILIRRRLGLPDPEEADEGEPRSPEELRAQVEALYAHAAELEEYGRQRRADC
jgi:hypothetical protein